MRRSPKSKLDTQAEMPLQQVLENSMSEPVVIAVESAASNLPREKRKEDANKPLYLKRV